MKYTLTAVSYLNTKPLLFGLLRSPIAQQLDIQLAIPSRCAQDLSEGRAQIGLIPVGALSEIPAANIISDYCIGCVGTVRTVCIYADRPLQELTHIYLDYHSRTSVELVRLLLRDFWKLELRPIPATPGFEQRIGGTVGGLIIGDRAIGLEEKYPFVYDLGEAWLAHTNLPFVFAAWVSTVPLDPEFTAEFNTALARGIAGISDLLYLLPSPHPKFDLHSYFTHHISYQFDAPKKQALQLFLESIDK